MNDFYISSSQLIFVFDRNLDIRKRVFEFEEQLSVYFKTPFNILNIADNEDGNIPRFEAISHNGHSRIQVTQYRINLTTGYSQDFGKDFNKVKQYLFERRELLKNLVNKEKNQFFAYVMELAFPGDGKEINSQLKSGTGAMAIGDSMIDFTMLYSQPFKDNFYINVKCSKYNLKKFKIENRNVIRKEDSSYEQGIAIAIDLNTKRHFIETNSANNDILLSELENEIFSIVELNSLQSYLNGNLITNG